MNLKRRDRWLLLGTIVALMALFGAFGLGWTGYVLSWFGGLAKAASGGLLGWAIARYLFGLDISAQPDPLTKTIAGLGLCVMVGFGLLAGALAT